MGVFTLLFKIAIKNFGLFTEIAKILKIPQARTLIELLIKKPKKVGELLGNLALNQIQGLNKIFSVAKKQMIARKRVAEDLIVAARRKVESQVLSSSWLVWGEFHPDPTGTVGDLTLETKQGRQYTWPGVPFVVWNAMKKAKGSYGSGAGSVFWALYLRARKVSKFQYAVSTVFKIAGVKTKALNPFKDFGTQLKRKI